MPRRAQKQSPLMTEEQQRQFFSLVEQVTTSLEEHYQRSEKEPLGSYSVYRSGVDGTLQFFLDALGKCFPAEQHLALDAVAEAYERAWKGKPRAEKLVSLVSIPQEV